MFLIACGEAEPDFALLKDEDKLVNIITDMYIADAAINRQTISIRDSLRMEYRNDIKLIYDISESEFDTVFWLLQQENFKYIEVHDKVLKKLTEMNKIDSN